MATSSSPFLANVQTQAIVEQSTADVLHLKVEEVAARYKISPTTLTNLVQSESSFDPGAKGDKGCSWGLVQINICAHKDVDKADALDPGFALSYAAKAISSGTDDAWSVCNCYAYVQANYIKNLPRMADIQPNTNVPHKGFVAIFYYGKIKHIAYVIDDKGTVDEANKVHCLVAKRVIHKDDPYLAGYYDPTV